MSKAKRSVKAQENLRNYVLHFRVTERELADFRAVRDERGFETDSQFLRWIIGRLRGMGGFTWKI